MTRKAQLLAVAAALDLLPVPRTMTDIAERAWQLRCFCAMRAAHHAAELEEYLTMIDTLDNTYGGQR